MARFVLIPARWLLVLFLMAGTLHADELAWKYVVPAAGEPMEHPPLFSLPLSEKRPEIVEGEPTYASGRPLYGLLRYGSDTSPQVVLVVDPREDGEFNLYVNAERDLKISAKHVAAGQGTLRRAAITSEITYLDRVAEQYPRQVVFRRGVLGTTISVATLGYLEGRVKLGSRTVSARRVDGDANGLFSDLRDRLWLDLNADGKWDAFSEQFPMRPVLVLEGKRFAVRSDQAGTRLSLDEITGVGTIKLHLATLPTGTKIRELEVSLAGDDGSAYAARADGAAVEVPEGGYFVRAVRVSVEHGTPKKPWNFIFSRYELPAKKQWQTVNKGEEITLDPIGPLRLVLEGAELDKPIQPGHTITANPRLYTAGGLLINSCDFNEKPLESWRTENQNTAEVTLCQTDGTRVGSHTSGFA